MERTDWQQLIITLDKKSRGLHLVTQEIQIALEKELKKFKVGLVHLFLMHTSASIAICENADPTVRIDMEVFLNRLAPESDVYHHSSEGPDDMPAHLKTVVVGHDLTIPVRDHHLHMGTWQGIYLFEYRDHAGSRSIVCTIHGKVV